MIANYEKGLYDLEFVVEKGIPRGSRDKREARLQ
jgi:hypothetical protein